MRQLVDTKRERGSISTNKRGTDNRLERTGDREGCERNLDLPKLLLVDLQRLDPGVEC
jgi:hypothetical protein